MKWQYSWQFDFKISHICTFHTMQFALKKLLNMQKSSIEATFHECCVQTPFSTNRFVKKKSHLQYLHIHPGNLTIISRHALAFTETEGSQTKHYQMIRTTGGKVSLTGTNFWQSVRQTHRKMPKVCTRLIYTILPVNTATLDSQLDQARQERHVPKVVGQFSAVAWKHLYQSTSWIHKNSLQIENQPSISSIPYSQFGCYWSSLESTDQGHQAEGGIWAKGAVVVSLWLRNLTEEQKVPIMCKWNTFGFAGFAARTHSYITSCFD